jgi:hypothetical protein
VNRSHPYLFHAGHRRLPNASYRDEPTVTLTPPPRSEGDTATSSGEPETDHDFRLDVIVAGEEVIACRRTRRPPGILWDHLDAAKIASVPALAART